MANLVTADWGSPDGNPMTLDTSPSSIGERGDFMGLTRMVGRAADAAVARQGIIDPETGVQIQPPEPSVPRAALDAKWGVDGPTPGLSWHPDSDMPESVAMEQSAAKRNEIARADAAARSPGGVGSLLGDLGYDFLDPLSLAAGALPVFGEARIASLLGRAGLEFGEGMAGRAALRAATGAADASVANVPLVGLRYALSQREQADYGMADAARDLAYGALFGAVLHPAIGALGDLAGGRAPAEPAPAPREDPLMEAARAEPGAAALAESPVMAAASMHAATAAVLEDRPVDVAPFAQTAALRAEPRTAPEAAGAAPLESAAPLPEGQPAPARPDTELAASRPESLAAADDIADAHRASPAARAALGEPAADEATTLRLATEAAKAPPDEPLATSSAEIAAPAPAAAAAPATPLYAKVPKEPERLINFLRRAKIFQPGTIHEVKTPGGLRDVGGDIKAIIGGAKGRPGLINNRTGVHLDAATLQAWEAGYFPDHPERPEINDLLEAIRDDHTGIARYSAHDDEAREAYLHALAHNAEIDRLAAEHGIDTAGLSREQFFDRLHDQMSQDEMAALEHETGAAYDEFASDANSYGWHDDEARTLEDLEREYEQQAHASAETGDGDGGDAGRETPAGGESEGAGRGGQAGHGAGSSGRRDAQGRAEDLTGDAPAEAAPASVGKLSPKMAARMAEAEQMVAAARAAGLLSAADEAELRAIDEEAAQSPKRQSAILQAAACIARGMA